MKKLLTLLLVALMTFSMVACGEETTSTNDSVVSNDTSTEESTNNEVTKEEMLEQALEVNEEELSDLTFENLAKAKNEYCNKTLKFSGWIQSVEEDYVVVGDPYNRINVYLSLDELMLLEKYQYITVVGQTTDSVEKVGSDMVHYQMPVAYLVSDTIEVTVEFDSYGLKEEGSNIYMKLTWAEGVDAGQYKGHKLIISAKAKAVPTQQVQYYEATVVEIIE